MQKHEALKYIEVNYLNMPDQQIAEQLNISFVLAQKLRIQNGYIKDSDSKRLINKLHRDTLCWSCKNSVPSPTCGCSWSEWLEPVEGWLARPVMIDGIGESWHVYRCPEYVGDDRKRRI